MAVFYVTLDKIIKGNDILDYIKDRFDIVGIFLGVHPHYKR